MSEDDVDPENPRPEGHYPRFRDNKWHYVPDELAQTISLGPAGDGEQGQDWVLTFTPERRNKDDREKVLVRLTPRALHELYIETKSLSTDQRMQRDTMTPADGDEERPTLRRRLLQAGERAE
ncbi:hypothetical protein [Halosegnis rubeus]|jgi:hypothetical protein|uniref:hypothetical protein n=1 Tax=Halosegnis rubeus TaxID=2212850 RepID=UPI001CEC275E|nr:hypothetical protein [Halosegnis rubeus]